MPVTNGLLSALAGVVPPALLTNASSVLLMGLGNRVARVVDRTRTVASVMATAEDDPALLAGLEYQAGLLKRRREALGQAIRLGYFALGGFASEVVVAVSGGMLAQYGLVVAERLTTLLALTIGVISVGSLVAVCVHMVRESTLALDNLEEEARTVGLEALRNAGSAQRS